MEKQKKVKAWFEDHKDEIMSNAIRFGYYAFGFGLGYFVSHKMYEYRASAGLATLHSKGIIKLCDPSTGLEIDMNKAVEIAKEMNK